MPHSNLPHGLYPGFRILLFSFCIFNYPSPSPLSTCGITRHYAALRAFLMSPDGGFLRPTTCIVRNGGKRRQKPNIELGHFAKKQGFFAVNAAKIEAVAFAQWRPKLAYPVAIPLGRSRPRPAIPHFAFLILHSSSPHPATTAWTKAVQVEKYFPRIPTAPLPLQTRKMPLKYLKKKPHRNAVYNSSFERFRNRWNPIDFFRLPVKACRPQPK